MATRKYVEIVSDISGERAAETVEFKLDGVAYEIDLTAGEASDFREALDQYVQVARRSSARKSKGRRVKPSDRGSEPSAAAIREWATASGYEVPARGRIPAEIRRAYTEAH